MGDRQEAVLVPVMLHHKAPQLVAVPGNSRLKGQLNKLNLSNIRDQVFIKQTFQWD
jgi:hypothetical protein